MNGNLQHDVLVGSDLILLVLGTWVYPDAKAAELAAFIVQHKGNVSTNVEITSRLKELKYSRKRASKDAYKTFEPINIQECEYLFSQPPSHGVVGLQRKMLMDFDKASFCLEKCGRNYSHGPSEVRVRKLDHYTKRRKLTLILGIEPGDPNIPAHLDGSLANPRRWFQVLMVSGIKNLIFHNFVMDVM